MAEQECQVLTTTQGLCSVYPPLNIDSHLENVISKQNKYIFKNTCTF